jgi:Na+/phosphate symporter
MHRLVWIEQCIRRAKSRELRHQDERQRSALRFHEAARKVKAIATDRLRSYKAALAELGCEQKQEAGRWTKRGSSGGFRRSSPETCQSGSGQKAP